MGVRRVLMLFFTTMALSLVILVVVFNLLFKNIDLEFETKIPESAPTLDVTNDKDLEKDEKANLSGFSIFGNAFFQQKGLRHADLNLPGQWQPVATASAPATEEDLKKKVV